MKARTLAPVRPSRPRTCLMYYRIYPRVSEDHPDRSWMLQMGSLEPIVHDLHQSLVELLERPEILSLHAVRRVGRERQLHLKVRALCGEVEKVFRRVGRHVSSSQLGQGWPTSTRVSDRQSETCQAEGGERPVHGGRHEGSGHWAAVREPS